MDASKHNKKILVLGLGNTLLGDLGAGIEVIHRMRRCRTRPRTIDLVRAGLVNVSLARVISQYEGLIIVESRPIGGKPGNIVELQDRKMDEFLLQQTGDDATLADIFGLLKPAGQLPTRRALMVIQPASTQVGNGLSKPVATALPLLIKRVVARSEDWHTPRRQTPGAALVGHQPHGVGSR
jgi:hydrogenase maturation protease